jgi:hypothetical protein
MPEAIDPNLHLSYLILGLVVIVGILALYTASLVVRNRNLHKDMETLEQLGEE